MMCCLGRVYPKHIDVLKTCFQISMSPLRQVQNVLFAMCLVFLWTFGVGASNTPLRGVSPTVGNTLRELGREMRR